MAAMQGPSSQWVDVMKKKRAIHEEIINLVHRQRSNNHVEKVNVTREWGFVLDPFFMWYFLFFRKAIFFYLVMRFLVKSSLFLPAVYQIVIYSG